MIDGKTLARLIDQMGIDNGLPLDEFMEARDIDKRAIAAAISLFVERYMKGRESGEYPSDDFEALSILFFCGWELGFICSSELELQRQAGS